nr:site-specific integrase [[Ruminococcus] torques]
MKRKAEVENQQNNGTFLPPNNQKVSDFLYDFVSTYGEKKWGVSMYDSQTALIANYINPIIGDMEVQDITTRVVDKYIQTLQKTPSVSRKNRKARTEFVTNSTIEKIIKLLRCAFKQAVRWELIEKNPFDNVVLPKTEYKKRDIWDAETIRLALDQCTDSKLYIAMNLAFACSLRMGEILGLTWKNVHIEDENIATDNAYIYIEAELARASKQAIETLGEKDIYHIFTPLMPNTSTRIILKKPKTDSSIRKVWLPKTVAYILREWKTSQEELKSFLGDEYQDFDLVVALPNGRPCENRIIEKEFSLLKQKAGLPNVVFHSLRHSSTTYKLKLNHGDLKVTQGDTGHAEIDMITKVYAHILDEDRKINAQKFESAFYANPDLRKVTPPQEQPQAQTIDLAALIEQLQKSPELANTLAALIAGQKAV